MSSETEKILSSALDVFNTKLSDRQVIKLEGMDDYLKVPQYKALVNLEKKASQLEVQAVMRIMTRRIAYLKAVQELRECEKLWLDEIRQGMDSLEERNRIVKDVNTKMRKGDYSMLLPSITTTSTASENHDNLNEEAKSPTFRKPETAKPTLPPENPIVKVTKPELSDIKKRIAMMNITMDTPSRPPLHSINVNKHVEITNTPTAGPFLSSKGSLDGSVVPNRAPMTPLSASKWDVPAPNFDDTIDTEPIKSVFRGTASSHRPLPSALLKSSDDEKEEGDDTFPLSRPSMPFRTPTVPHSRPFLLSSMRKEPTKEEETLPVRPFPTPVSIPPPSTSADPLSNMGLMKLKRPVLNSEVGKKLMGQL